MSASSSSVLLPFFCFCFFALARSGGNRCWCELLLLHAHPAAKTYSIGLGYVIKLCNRLVLMRLTLASAAMGCCWVSAWRQPPCGCSRLPLAGSGRRQPPRSCVMEQQLHSGSSCCCRGGWEGEGQQ